MAELGAIRTALADTVGAALPAVNTYRVPPTMPVAPCFIVAGFEIEPTNNSGGRDITAVCWVGAEGRSDENLDELDEMVDDTDDSVWTAVTSNPTLGGLVDFVVIEGVSDYRDVEASGSSFNLATMRVRMSA